MGLFAVGDVVLCLFPFSDIVQTGNAKKRPCLVVGYEEHGDIIVAQITTKAYKSQRAIMIDQKSFLQGGLRLTSYIRPDKLFTTDPVLIERTIGTLHASKRNSVLTAIRAVFSYEAGDQ